MSVAALLVFLLTAFALSPPEILYRGHHGNRSRANRVASLEDQEQDHALDVQRVSDLADAGTGDSPAAATPPRVGIPPGPPGFTGELFSLASDSALFCVFLGRSSGRAPPLVLS